MAIQTITTFVRPNTGVAFFTSADNAAVLASYVAAGKLIDTKITDSVDGLIRTFTRTFSTAQAQADFKADPARAAVIEARRAYNLANDISMTVEYTTA